MASLTPPPAQPPDPTRLPPCSASSRALEFCAPPGCPVALPAGKTEALERWAVRCTRWPPVERLRETLRLGVDESLGLFAIAARNFKRGDLVISEDAFLRIPEVSLETHQRLERRYGARAAFLLPGLSIDWRNVSEEVRQASLTLFFEHRISSEGRSLVLSDSGKACEDAMKWAETLGGLWKVDDLVRFLHIVDLNIHRDDDQAHAAFTGLFVLGSKFSHSCAPNCTWSFSSDGCLQYHAIRPIAPGDMLTFSYIGNGMNMIVDTTSRRMRLADLWFVCQCPRCVGPDLVRKIICPHCRSPSCCPVGDSSPAVSWTGDRPLRESLPETKAWRCEACAATCTSAEMPLRSEEELIYLVPEVLQQPPETASRDRATAASIRGRITRELGTAHWTWMLATFAWLQKSHIQLVHDSVIVFTELDLREACRAVAKWFGSCAPENIEQRLAALSLAVGLAQNFGEEVSAWGYHADDPAVCDLEFAWISFQAEGKLPRSDRVCIAPKKAAGHGGGSDDEAHTPSTHRRRYRSHWC